MPYLLRKIRRSKWYSKEEGIDWLPEEEVQADALTDLITKSNQLSVWFVPEDRGNISKIVAALSLSGDNVSVVDYALLNVEILSKEGFQIAENPGGTPFESANLWHRDIVNLSAGKVLKLVTILKKAEKNRCLDKQALEHIKEALRDGKVDLSKINLKLHQSLTRRGIVLNIPATS
jgi:hypothetical protein